MTKIEVLNIIGEYKLKIPYDVYYDLKADILDFESEETSKIGKPTGKWTPEIEPDNRAAEPIDITDENARVHDGYNREGLMHCPHCDCTIPLFNVMPHHYCYVCGGKFGERNLSIDKEVEGENEEY